MTERIKALGRQASKLALEEYHARQKTEFVGDVIYSDIYDQKFAELIVKECAAIMDKDVDHPYNSRGSILKYHFGVDQ